MGFLHIFLATLVTPFLPFLRLFIWWVCNICLQRQGAHACLLFLTHALLCETGSLTQTQNSPHIAGLSNQLALGIPCLHLPKKE